MRDSCRWYSYQPALQVEIFQFQEETNMPKVILMAQVQDPVKWEAGFRTHGDLFRKYTLGSPINFAISGNQVTICMEPDNLTSFKQAVESQATAACHEPSMPQSSWMLRATIPPSAARIFWTCLVEPTKPLTPALPGRLRVSPTSTT